MRFTDCFIDYDILIISACRDVMPYHLMTGKSINALSSTSKCRSSFLIDDSHLGEYIDAIFELTGWGSHPDSKLTSTVRLSATSPVIEFRLAVVWKETHKLLKVEFPVTIRSTTASYGTPFGVVRRPTHGNSSQDAAMFESCGHRFADLSEEGYGVAILCGSK